MSGPTPAQRAEWRKSANWHDDEHLDCDDRILALLDALDAADATLARVERVLDKWDVDPDAFFVHSQARGIASDLRAALNGADA